MLIIVRTPLKDGTRKKTVIIDEERDMIILMDTKDKTTQIPSNDRALNNLLTDFIGTIATHGSVEIICYSVVSRERIYWTSVTSESALCAVLPLFIQINPTHRSHSRTLHRLRRERDITMRILSKDKMRMYEMSAFQFIRLCFDYHNERDSARRPTMTVPMV